MKILLVILAAALALLLVYSGYKILGAISDLDFKKDNTRRDDED